MPRFIASDVMSSPTASASAVADIISALEDLIDDEPTPHQVRTVVRASFLRFFVI